MKKPSIEPKKGFLLNAFLVFTPKSLLNTYISLVFMAIYGR